MSADRRTRWGWHQLADSSARRLVAASGVRSGDLVLDIGAGTGALTTALLRRLLSRGSRLVTADLVVPRHVAVRWASGRGAGAHPWSAMFDARIVAQLPRSAFRPRPPGESAVLRLERRA